MRENENRNKKRDRRGCSVENRYSTLIRTSNDVSRKHEEDEEGKSPTKQ